MAGKLSEYWCDRKILVTIDGPHRHSTIRIDKPFARIGSHQASDIVLDHDDVDKRSLYLHATNAGIFCFGLSTAQSDLRGWMDPNEAVAVGPYWISAQLTDPAEFGQDDPEDDVFSLTDPAPQLMVNCDGQPAGKLHLKRRLSILGRHAPAKLRLQGQQISGAHCAFFVDDGTTWVIDLLSAAGTLVRNQVCDVTTIDHGDEVGLANVVLTLRLGGREPAESLKDASDTTNQELLVAEGKDEGGRMKDEMGQGSVGTVASFEAERMNEGEVEDDVAGLDDDEDGGGEDEIRESTALEGHRTSDSTDLALPPPDAWDEVAKEIARASSQVKQQEVPREDLEKQRVAEAKEEEVTETVGETTDPKPGQNASRPRLVRQEKKNGNGNGEVAQHPHRPLSAEIDKLAREMIDEPQKAPPPPSKPKPIDEKRPADELDRVTNRLVDIEIHKKRQRLWWATSKVLVFLVVTGICAAGLTVAYQLLPPEWKPLWGKKEEAEDSWLSED